MQKIPVAILSFFLLISSISLKADEGMWLPLFVGRLNNVDLQAQGCHLTPQEIYNVNNASLKDAIIQFGGGCTGEVVSPNGLIFTNHHCGFGSIQSLSSVDHDYLTNGFWAYRLQEELPVEGLTARFLVSISDVTASALADLKMMMSEDSRNAQIKANIAKIEKNAVNGKGQEARVASFFNGNEYYLFIYKVYKDVRLVGTPPVSIGKFGGDTDNWMWPRHTGDFSIFRIYAGPDNEPALYSAENIPFTPKKYLPLSIKGFKENDFTMIMGYPGTTDRYATSYTIDWATEINNPAIVKIRTKKLDIMREDMDADQAIYIKYASKYAGTANYWKFFNGQARDLKRLHIADRKRDLEEQFANWAAADQLRFGVYRSTLLNISKAYESINKYELAVRYNQEAINRGCEIINFSRQMNSLAEILKNRIDTIDTKPIIDKLLTSCKKYYKDYNAPTDQKLLAAMLELYYNDVPQTQQTPYLKQLFLKYKGYFSEYARFAFEKSIFASQQKYESFLANPSFKTLRKDPVWILQEAFAVNAAKIDSVLKPSQDMLAIGRRLFVKGIREMQPNRKFAPDANSTMRFTYGRVMDYSPADGVEYDYVTTLKGIIDKSKMDVHDYLIPKKLEELYNSGDYGRYAENGKMIVAFLTNNDITGGNSGSPVMNADGELIGLAFDGNWEAMSGNYAFEPELQRTICVDIRYVLFIIDKYAGAQNLIDELEIRM